MREKILFTVFFCCLFYSTFASDKGENVKKGWSVGPLPALGFDSDRGFLLGATGELYYFGDGSIYPGYFHKFKTEVSFYTKGSANIQAYYDSKYLIKGVRTMFDVGYFPDKYYDFYGLNAYSYSNLQHDGVGDSDDKSKVYNKIDRSLFRFQADFQKNLVKDLHLAAGIGVQSYKINRVKDNDYKNDITLFDIYEENGLLASDELIGHTHLLLKLGLVYDTRDLEADPGKGFYSELIFSGDPIVGYDHLRLSVTHRHYFNLIENRLTLAGRIGYQGTLAGDVPYYLLQNMHTFFQRRLFNEGLGGNTTIRGISRNRLVADGIGLANLELRWKFYRFKLIKQDFALALTPFVDAGMILNEHNPELFETLQDYENPVGKLHTSLGVGLKVIMNQNFVVSIDAGKALQKEDGNIGFYILLNYMF